MLDKFDYAEPNCPLCDGEDFYYPKQDAPLGTVPVGRVIAKVDALFGKNDCAEAGRVLERWRAEAVALRDRRGELAMESELVGYYRKQGQKDKGLASCARALALVEELEQGSMASGATVFINCATAYKAFGMASEAIPLYRRAEAVYNEALSPDDPRFGGLYNNMALALTDLCDYSAAEKAYWFALSVMELSESGQAECAITYVNMAHMYEAWDRTDRIAGCMDKAHALLMSESLPHNGYYAFVLEKCAPSFGYFGDADTCERMKQEARDIYARA